MEPLQMPLYDYKCSICREVKEHMVRFADLETASFFCCGGQTERIISPPHLAVDYPGYECPVTGAWIEGRRAHRENLKRTGCRILEPGESQMAMSLSKLRAEEQLNEAVDKAVEKTAEQLHINF